MSETDDQADREAIREKKREQLRERLEDAGFDEPVHVEGPDHLRDLVGSNDVVLVDFYADWCGPCQALEPVVESIAGSTDAVVAKVDIDEHQGIARDSNVRGVPTLVVYEGGDPVERLVGAQQERRLRSVLENHGA